MDENLPLKESCAVFNHEKEITVVFQKTKPPAKHVSIMTNLHFNLHKVEGNKTEATMFYNATKGGVDAFDQLCANTDTGRMTRRWPVCIFFASLNIALNNSWIIYKSRRENMKKEKKDFGIDLASRLAEPWAIRRYNERGGHLRSSTRAYLEEIYKLGPHSAPPADVPAVPDQAPVEHVAEGQPPVIPIAVADRDDFPGRVLHDKRLKCVFCPPPGFKGKEKCNTCLKSVCPSHSVLYCKDCYGRGRR